jgi:hypothetical protein
LITFISSPLRLRRYATFRRHFFDVASKDAIIIIPFTPFRHYYYADADFLSLAITAPHDAITPDIRLFFAAFSLSMMPRHCHAILIFRRFHFAFDDLLYFRRAATFSI